MRLPERAHRADWPRRVRTGGFSLVEVLIAILILGVALVGLTQGLSLALQSNKESEAQTSAALLAAGQVETLRAEGGLLDGEKDGDCEGSPMYRWRRSITPAGIDGLHEVLLTIENAKTGKAVYELRTLLFEAAEQATATGRDDKKGMNGRRRGTRRG